jgi:hypothetical protein
MNSMKPSTQLSDDSLNEGDPNQVQSTPLNAQRWTLGDSRSIVAGTAKEPLSATIAWLVVPTLIFGLLAFVFLGSV